MAVKNYRTELLLHCHSCGVKSPFYLKDPLKCPSCGKGIRYVCKMCGHKFMPKDLCMACRWWICPNCDTCGCHYYDKYKRVSKEEEAMGFIKIMIERYPNIAIWLSVMFQKPYVPRKPERILTEETQLHELM